MTITIITIASPGGNLNLYLTNLSKAHEKVLVLHGNDHGSSLLIQGDKYRFEWHVVSSMKANYSIDANVSPENSNFKKLDWKQAYPGGHEDAGLFEFVL